MNEVTRWVHHHQQSFRTHQAYHTHCDFHNAVLDVMMDMMSQVMELHNTLDDLNHRLDKMTALFDKIFRLYHSGIRQMESDRTMTQETLKNTHYVCIR